MGGHVPLAISPACPREIEEDGPPPPAPPPITSLDDWAHMLLTNSHEEIASLAALYHDHTSPSCEDVYFATLIRPSEIQHFVCVGWQGTLEIQECLDGLFKVLQLDPSTSLLQKQELDQILCLGEAPTRWTRSRHFPLPGSPTHTTIPTCCGP